MPHSKTNQGLQLLEQFGKWLCNPSSDLASINTEVAKEVLSCLGVNHRGWRLFLDYHLTLKSSLKGLLIFKGKPLSSVENLAAYLVLLQQCEMDIIPPADFEKAWITSASPDTYAHIGEVPVELFRATWKGFVSQQNSTNDRAEFFATELPLVVEWHFASQQEEDGSCAQLKQGWGKIVLKAIDWKQRCQHSYDNAPPDWPGVMCKSFVMDGIWLNELLSVKQVEEEAEMMHHCIDTYIDRCQQSEYRVISLREPMTGERLATLGLVRNLDLWEFDDLRSPDNGDPGEYLESVADRVIRDINHRVASTLKPGMPEKFRLLIGMMRWAASTGLTSFEEISEFALEELNKSDEQLGQNLPLTSLYICYLFILEELPVDRELERRKMKDFKQIKEIKRFDQIAQSIKQKSLSL